MGARTINTEVRRSRSAVLLRPLEALIFLLPLILFYEFTVLQRHGSQLVATDIIDHFWALFGPVGTWAPALSVVVILLATHVASREPWSIRPRRVAWMYVESILLAVPLFLLNRAAFLASPAPAQSSLLDDIGLSIGAGIYEELVFRLVLMSLITMVGVDLMRFKSSSVAVFAIVSSSLLFAAYHHAPLGSEPFSWHAFLFRAAAGMYLALIFWIRGYGLAAGAHAAYNVAIVALGRA